MARPGVRAPVRRARLAASLASPMPTPRVALALHWYGRVGADPSAFPSTSERPRQGSSIRAVSIDLPHLFPVQICSAGLEKFLARPPPVSMEGPEAAPAQLARASPAPAARHGGPDRRAPRRCLPVAFGARARLPRCARLAGATGSSCPGPPHHEMAPTPAGPQGFTRPAERHARPGACGALPAVHAGATIAVGAISCWWLWIAARTGRAATSAANPSNAATHTTSARAGPPSRSRRASGLPQHEPGAMRTRRAPESSLARRKRFYVFREGSSLSVDLPYPTDDPEGALLPEPLQRFHAHVSRGVPLDETQRLDGGADENFRRQVNSQHPETHIARSKMACKGILHPGHDTALRSINDVYRSNELAVPVTGTS